MEHEKFGTIPKRAHICTAMKQFTTNQQWWWHTFSKWGR
jgi:hypothetical protein